MLARPIVTLVTLVRMIAGLALIGSAPRVPAQDYPTRPIKLVVPGGPGVPPDIVARTIAPPLAAHLGQPVVVDNRPGGTLAQIAVADAPADGYTLLLAHTSVTIAPAIMAQPGYDPIQSFAPVGRVTAAPLVLFAHAGVPATSMKELLTLARAKPGELHFAGATGTLPHLAGFLLMSEAGIRLTYVPYKSANLAYPDFAAGRIQVLFNLVGVHEAQVRSGQLRALAVTGPARHPVLPEVPTMSEAGLPGMELGAFFGIVAPRGTPAEIVQRLNAELGRILQLPEVADALKRQGGEPSPMSPAAFASFIASETARWARVVKASGTRAE